jgi:hypothetical protein
MFGGFAGRSSRCARASSPESFNFLESAIILAIVVLGGMGSQFGVAIAAVVLVGGPEVLRNLGFLQAIFGSGFDPNEYRLLLFGLAMVAMMVWRPRGLISERDPPSSCRGTQGDLRLLREGRARLMATATLSARPSANLPRPWGADRFSTSSTSPCASAA